MRGRKANLVDDPKPVDRVPSPPSWLSKDAAAEWRRIMPLLVERRILTDADLGSVEAYCIATGQVRETQRVIAREGMIVQTKSGPRKHPAVAIQSDAMTRARLIANELGLTPVSRSRPAIREASPDDDALSDLDI